jgi:hypothetical protein
VLKHQVKKRLSPAGASPPFFFLRPGPPRCPAGFTRLAMTPADTKGKQNVYEH